jgi:hypothetical protein
MSEHPPTLADPRIPEAVAHISALIRRAFPDAVLEDFIGEDPEGVYVRVTVDLDDPDEVLDAIVDDLYEIQVEQFLPVYVIPVQPLERIAEHLRHPRHEPSPATLLRAVHG